MSKKIDTTPHDFFILVVARRGAHLAAERSPSTARADGARRSQTARTWPRAAQH